MGHEWLAAKARERLETASCLRKQNRDWPLVYYLSGHAVEFALWAIRCQRAGLSEPDHQNLHPPHDLNRLVVLIGLDGEVRQQFNKSRGFAVNWRAVTDWDSNSRFEKVSRQDAKDLFLAATNPVNGVMPWLMSVYQTG